MSRTFFVFPIAIALGLTLGLSGLLHPASESNKVLPVLAQGCTHSANYACSPKTSAMLVRYNDLSAASVIPNGSTDWTITAHWYPASGSNCTNAQVATCTVTWNGSAWSLSGVNLPGGAGITNIGLCSTEMCGGASLAVGYTLIVSVVDPVGADNLDHVDYVTTAVPNGTVCGGLGTSPLSQTNSGSHYISTGNTNLCNWTCSVSGGSMAIVYN